MEHQNLGSVSTSACASGSDCTVVIKEEPKDDFAQTADGSDMEELNIPITINTPIITKQTEMCKIEDTPDVKLEMHSEESENLHPAVVKIENDSIFGDCNQSSKTTNIVQDYEGDNQLIEVPGEIDRRDDISDVSNVIGVGRVIPTDMKENDATPEELVCNLECSNDIKTEGM